MKKAVTLRLDLPDWLRADDAAMRKRTTLPQLILDWIQPRLDRLERSPREPGAAEAAESPAP
jgi:hypothetical protein